jgi:hypothetical protein
MWNKEIFRKDQPGQISQIWGTIIAIGLIVYFLIMYFVGVIHVIELRLLNLFIMLPGVYFALKQYRLTHHDSLNYFRALTIGTAAAAIGTSTFALFLFFFLKVEGNLMQAIQQNEPLGRYLNPYISSFAVMLEGLFSGFGLTYLLANYIRTDNATIPQGGDLPVTPTH